MRFRAKSLYILVLAFFCLAAGCARDDEYDLDKIDKELTLFEDEFAIPLGNLGPITFRDLIGDILGQLMDVDDEGNLWFKTDRDIYTVSAFEIASKMENPDTCRTWRPADQQVSVSFIGSILRYVGVKCLNQRLMVYLENPLKKAVDIDTDVKVSYLDEDFDEAEVAASHISSTAWSLSETEIAEIAITDDILYGIDKISLENISFGFPKEWTKYIPENVNSHFTFRLEYECNIAFAGSFHLTQAFNLKKVKLGLGEFKVKECDITADIENSFPVDLTLNSLQVYTDSLRTQVDENIVIEQNIHVAPGYRVDPSRTPVVFHVKALEGTIPDITGLRLDVTFKVPDESMIDPIHMDQGISLKNISAKVTGGVTINLNKGKEEDEDAE